MNRKLTKADIHRIKARKALHDQVRREQGHEAGKRYGVKIICMEENISLQTLYNIVNGKYLYYREAK